MTGGTSTSDWTTHTTGTLTKSVLDGNGWNDVDDILDFGGAVLKYIVITPATVNGNYYGVPTGIDDHTVFGLAEVVFAGPATAVPEIAAPSNVNIMEGSSYSGSATIVQGPVDSWTLVQPSGPNIIGNMSFNTSTGVFSWTPQVDDNDVVVEVYATNAIGNSSSVSWNLIIDPIAMAAEAELVSLERIWDEAIYNSFTDLTRFEGKWYCTFRESDSHELGLPGKIRVITSVDGDSWSSVALFEVSEPNDRDLRDPKICVTSDNRLAVRTEACLYENNVQVTRDSRISFSDDGITWGPLQIQDFNCPGEHATDGHRLWRISWYDGKAYGVSQLINPNRVILVTSDDGLHWDQITPFSFPTASYGTVAPSETTVRILEDETMVALVRQRFVGTSPPPYTVWDWQEIPLAHSSSPHVCPFGGPNFIQLPDGSLWASSREYHRTDGFRKPTVLFEMTYTDLERKLTFPSGISPDYEDSSYAGMVWNPDDNLLWMSYYSSHECTASSPGPKIYLAKVRVPYNCGEQPVGDIAGFDCKVNFKDLKVMVDDWLLTAEELSDANLAAWYEFEGDASDSSGNGPDGIESGGPSYTTGDGGRFGEAVYFDGTDDFITLGDSSDLRLGDIDMSLSLWIKSPDGGWDGNDPMIVGDEKWDNPTGPGFLLNVESSTSIVAGVIDLSNNKAVLVPQDNLGDNQWHHIVYTVDRGNDVFKLYIDAQPKGTASISGLGSFESGNPWRVAQHGPDDPLYWCYYQGWIDDLRFYNRVLPLEEIESLMNTGGSSLRLIADLDENNRVDFKDLAMLMADWFDDTMLP